jgi:hypothetical protein
MYNNEPRFHYNFINNILYYEYVSRRKIYNNDEDMDQIL